MAAKKRATSRSRRSGLVGRAVRAGRKALRQAESRVPPDLRKQIERTVKDGQKTVMSAVHELETRVNRSARQADVDKVLKRLEGLTKQVQKLAHGASSRGAARTTAARRRTTTATRRPTKTATGTAKRKASTAKRKAPARKAAATKPAARKAAARKAPRRVSPRRASSGTPVIRSVPEAPAPGPMPVRVDTGDSSA